MWENNHLNSFEKYLQSINDLRKKKKNKPNLQSYVQNNLAKNNNFLGRLTISKSCLLFTSNCIYFKK